MITSEHLSEFWEFSAISCKLTTHEHDADGEDFLGVCVGAHVAKTDTGETTEREVERGDICARHGGSTRGAVDVRGLQTLSQLLKPAWGTRSEDGCVRLMCGYWVANFGDVFFSLCLLQWKTLSHSIGDIMGIG